VLPEEQAGPLGDIPLIAHYCHNYLCGISSSALRFWVLPAEEVPFRQFIGSEELLGALRPDIVGRRNDAPDNLPTPQNRCRALIQRLSGRFAWAANLSKFTGLRKVLVGGSF